MKDGKVTETIFMETTKIAPGRSAGQITEALIGAGATQIATDYKNGKIVGLRWTMAVEGQDLLFSMPARVTPVFELLKKRLQQRRTFSPSPADLIQLQEKAERIAWRQLLRWVQAQVAMMEIGMVKAREVFLPYWRPGGNDSTLFELLENNRFKALPAPGEQG